jgi:hypothetical protein
MHLYRTIKICTTMVALFVSRTFCNPCFSQNSDGGRLKVLIIADERAQGVGKQVGKAADKLEHTLQAIFRNVALPSLHGRLQVNRTGRELKTITYREIESAIDSLSVTASDTVFVVYHGHGALDPIYGRTLTPTQGPSIPRSVLKKKISATPARLKILITDCCSQALTSGVEGASPDDPILKCYDDLFFRHTGFLDIASSSENERAWADADGGIYLQTFADILEGPLHGHSIDANNDGFTSWVEVFDQVNEWTTTFLDGRNEEYQALKEQFRWSPQVKLKQTPELLEKPLVLDRY